MDFGWILDTCGDRSGGGEGRGKMTKKGKNWKRRKRRKKRKKKGTKSAR